MRSVLAAVVCCVSALGADHGYIGAQVCSGCHREIASTQAKTNMARTWQGTAASQLPADYSGTHVESAVNYRVIRKGSGFEFQVGLPGRPQFSAPVETIVGGERHGLSFLYRVSEIEGLKLARPALIEGRYLYGSTHKGLLLSPGFPEQSPTTYETALGRVLSPDFEQKCLACHGSAKTKESHETGVRCENCHGPAEVHLAGVANGTPRQGVINPKKLSPAEQIQPCSPCHSGFGDLQDSIPDDLLISNQVNALKKSQCWIQSGGAFSCISCHNPHRDANVDSASVKRCTGCHATNSADRAALCPVNQKSDCLGCHMPVAQKGSFHMVDHWIRVHPEQNVKTPERDPELRTKTRPRELYLRMIVTNDRESANRARAELDRGAEFFDVAQKYSKDQLSALAGGYIGQIEPQKMDPRLASAALALERGTYSHVIDGDGRHVIIQRMSRDFLYEAERLEQQGSEFRVSGKLDQAVDAYTRALRIYPRFLRALVFLGVTFGQQQNPERGAAVLEYAARVYPEDPAVQYNLGIAYEALGRAEDAIGAYRKALELESDLIPAYLNLGGAFFQLGRLDDAARAYELGLQQNPLAAALYYNVAQVYEKQGRTEEAKHAAAVASKIDPKF